MFKSATVTLTWWYVLLAMILSLTFSGVLYHFCTQELAEGLDNQYQVMQDNDHDGDNRNPAFGPTYQLGIGSQHLLRDLAYFNVVVLVGSSVASYILARRTLRPIEIAHQAQIRFTAEASHELRTPLAAIKADTEAALMERSEDVGVLHRTLRDNLKDIERLEKLTNHLLEISRYTGGTAPIVEDVELAGLIREALKQFRVRIDESKLKVHVELEPAHVMGEPYGLSRLISIVLDNAIKYSHRKGTIRIHLTKDGEQAKIVIMDTGIGISKEDLPHIFDRFYRSKDAVVAKKEIDGYGLGLPLARDIVVAYKGSLSVECPESGGVLVTISLPKS